MLLCRLVFFFCFAFDKSDIRPIGNEQFVAVAAFATASVLWLVYYLLYGSWCCCCCRRLLPVMRAFLCETLGVLLPLKMVYKDALTATGCHCYCCCRRCEWWKYKIICLWLVVMVVATKLYIFCATCYTLTATRRRPKSMPVFVRIFCLDSVFFYVLSAKKQQLPVVVQR